MAQAKYGDSVQIHYTGKLDDEFVFDTSLEREPLAFKIGDGFVLEGFEQAVIGMSPGETKTFKLSAEQAYGSYHNEMVMKVPKAQFPSNITPEIGQQIQINDKDRPEPMVVVITDISDEHITLDANHPLAGKDLTFEIKLIAIDE
jgi:FKBP-type peptidyl-prolyl cis-trans isomerase 2